MSKEKSLDKMIDLEMGFSLLEKLEREGTFEDLCPYPKHNLIRIKA